MMEIKLYKTGVIAGNFDVLHPGYISMFNQMRDLCEEVYVLLHEDPSVERADKIKPILSVKERVQMLESLRQIDRVIPYKLEEDLLNLLNAINPEVRFLGDDYIGRDDYTGYELGTPIIYCSRDHGWSTTKYKQLIADSIK